MGLHIFERGVRWLIIGGVNPRGLITRREKRALEQVTAIAVLIKILFTVFTGFSSSLKSNSFQYI